MVCYRLPSTEIYWVDNDSSPFITVTLKFIFPSSQSKVKIQLEKFKLIKVFRLQRKTLLFSYCFLLIFFLKNLSRHFLKKYLTDSYHFFTDDHEWFQFCMFLTFLKACHSDLSTIFLIFMSHFVQRSSWILSII